MFKPTEASLGHIDCYCMFTVQEQTSPSLWSTDVYVNLGRRSQQIMTLWSKTFPASEIELQHVELL